MKFSLHLPSLRKGRAPNFSKFRMIYPERDWLLGLILSAMVFCAGAGYAGWLFLAGMHNLDDGAKAVGDPTTIYNHEKVSRVLKDYEARAKHFEELSAHVKAPLASSPRASASATSSTQVASSTENQ